MVTVASAVAALIMFVAGVVIMGVSPDFGYASEVAFLIGTIVIAGSLVVLFKS